VRRPVQWLAVGVVVAAGAATAGLALLDGDWLKAKLIEQARGKLGAELRIRSASFSPFKGEAELQGVELDRLDDDGSAVRARFDVLRTKVKLLPLLRRAVAVERLEAIGPRISWTLNRRADADTAPSPEGIMERFKKRLAGKSGKRFDLTIGELVIRDGTVELTATKPGQPPFTATATHVAYRARDVSLAGFTSLFAAAEIAADIDLGGVPAVLRKQGPEADPSTCYLSGINVAHLDRWFDQSDALVMTGGTSNLRYAIARDKAIDVTAGFDGLELGSNPAAAKQEFAFVPIARLQDFVSARRGKVDLAFTFGNQGDASDDLREVMDDVWVGMWGALIKSMASGGIKARFDEARERLRRGK
jgi:hypothetical protein